MTDRLIDQRNAEYRDAWKLEGAVCSIPEIQEGLHVLHNLFPEAWFPWIMILNKLLRALGSPKNIDHWADIAGYAQLVQDHLKGEQKQ